MVNISEGRRDQVIDRIAQEAGAELLDVHRDPHHNRSVLTLIGQDAPRLVTRAAAEHLDLRSHAGAHPRLGAIDVVPFVPLTGSTMADAVAARDDYADWVGSELGVPAFKYGPERSLPDVRRRAFKELRPDAGPPDPEPRLGAVAVGARPLLVAWNVYLVVPDLAEARRVAAAVRGPQLRALGLQVGDDVQVSMNLIAPEELGPAQAWDLVAGHIAIKRAELVGLVPQAVLAATAPDRWSQLDLDENRTIEARRSSQHRE